MNVKTIKKAHNAIMKAIETSLADGLHTKDLGGVSSTQELGTAISNLV